MMLWGWIITLLVVVDLSLRIGLSIRIVMRRRPIGVSLAWLFVVLLFPFAGPAAYLILGELRLGRARAARLERLERPYAEWLSGLANAFQVDWSDLGAASHALSRLATRAAGIPAVPGNRLELLEDWETCFRRLIADIDRAQRSCHMEFYIWQAGGLADEVLAALIRACERGVVCRILLDAVGSDRFLASDQARDLVAAGVQLESALPGGIFHLLVTRFDLRMHRKIVVIDGSVAYTGSLNLVDPRYFPRSKRFGQWVDAMVRFEGPAVEPLAITFLKDWELERQEGIEALRATADVRRHDAIGDAVVQVVPTGPAIEGGAIQILLTTIYSAQRELIITTPYFVPDEVLLEALISAARRGVAITILVPARVDSLLVRLASRAHVGDLLVAGVTIKTYQHGVLHTKSVTVDGEFCLFGSLNLDPRSLYLNFEITLAVFDRQFTQQVRALQLRYGEGSARVAIGPWLTRGPVQRFTDNAARLLGPLL